MAEAERSISHASTFLLNTVFLHPLWERIVLPYSGRWDYMQKHLEAGMHEKRYRAGRPPWAAVEVGARTMPVLCHFRGENFRNKSVKNQFFPCRPLRGALSSRHNLISMIKTLSFLTTPVIRQLTLRISSEPHWGPEKRFSGLSHLALRIVLGQSRGHAKCFRDLVAVRISC